MNKKIAVGLLILTTALGACDNKKREEAIKREREYRALLDKEYSEFPNTDRGKKFKERYEALLALTVEMDVTIDTLSDMEEIRPDSLCFESPMEWESYTYDDGLEQVIPFKDYTNRNGDVNAVFVTSEFFKKDDAQNRFELERKLHMAYKALQNDAFIRECAELDTSASYIYPEFCRARLDMDKLNNAKYFVILKKGLFSKWKIFGSGNNSLGDFFPGIYMANVVVYDIEQKKTVYVTGFIAMNSESIQYREGTQEMAFESDLSKNIKTELEHKMDSLIGIKGNFPLFFVDLTSPTYSLSE